MTASGRPRSPGRPRRSSCWLALAMVGAGLAMLAVARPAAAVDGQRLRTPVLWSGEPCMQVVDRSVATTVNLPYGIPFEDVDITEDEVADGRRHQFFALCRDHDPDEELPLWVSEADVAAAEALELIDLGTVVGDQILDLDPAWTGCALRINADADRRPITFAMADAGIDWDTAGLQAGTYLVEGFTHDPAFSQWWLRPGVLKVVDDPDPAASDPAAAVLNGEEVVAITEPVTIEGCVSAMPGSTLTASWAQVGAGDAWQPFVQDEPVAGESFAIEMLLPVERAGISVRVQVVVNDPMGRQYTAFMHERVITLPEPGSTDGGCETEGGCEATSGDADSSTSAGQATTAVPTDDTSDGTAATTTGDTAGASTADRQSDGCGCRSAPSTAPALWLCVLVGWRRRRS